MFCGECGTQNPDTNSFCKNCGKPLRKAGAAAVTPVMPVTVVQAGPVVTPSSPVQSGMQKRTWLGIISLIPAILAWILYPVLFGIIAVVIGTASIVFARKQRTRFPVAGVIAIIIGLLAIVLNIFWLDIFPPPQVLPPIQ
jgi:uncharacterized protein (DUF983 family)